MSKRSRIRLLIASGVAIYFVLFVLLGYFSWVVIGHFGFFLAGGIVYILAAGALILLSMSSREVIRMTTGTSGKFAKYEYRERWNSFTLLLSHLDELSGLCRVVLPEIMEILVVKKGSLWILDEERGWYDCAAVEGVTCPVAHVEVDNEFAQDLAEKGEPVPVGRLLDSGNIGAELVGVLKDVGAQVCAPLRIREKTIGFITLGSEWSEHSRGFEDYQMLKILNTQTAAAIYRQMLAEELATVQGMESLHRLSSYVIHDIKNAVNMLSMAVQNAEANIHKPQFQKDVVRTISGSVERMKRLVERLSFPLREMEQQQELLDLNKAIDKVVARLQLNTIDGVRLSCDFGESVRVIADQRMIEQLFENLLLNALQALPSSVGEIGIRTFSSSDDTVVAEISDTGCGIPSEVVERNLFRPFHTTKEKGLGIGLYHCKHIVTSQGGTISVQSKIGQGSTFRIVLPVHGGREGKLDTGKSRR
jgi:putative PEP-CTERM system histidine kinase